MARAMQSGLRTAAQRQVGALMGAGPLRCKKAVSIQDQDELPSVQRDRHDLPSVEYIESAGMNPAR